MARAVKPAALKSGDTIAMVAPSGTSPKGKLEIGVKRLQQSGFKVYIHPQCFKRRGYLAGDDKTRAASLMEAFTDKKIKAIICARGGYGCQRLLNYLDIDLIKKNPKIFVGYSDITVLLQAFNIDGFVTFHGPMPSVDLCRNRYHYALENLLKAITGTSPIGEVFNPKTIGSFKIYHGGKARGIITGGNLSLLDKLIGTPSLPSFKNKMVFIEDVDEDPYRLDGYLAHLFQASDISHAAGFIFGEFINCRITKRALPSLTLKQVLDDYFKKLKVPIISNVACGHGKENLTMPLGVMASIDGDKGKFMILESAVR